MTRAKNRVDRAFQPTDITRNSEQKQRYDFGIGCVNSGVSCTTGRSL